MGLSRTVTEINGDFSPKSQNFPTNSLYFVPLLKEFPLELGSGASGEKLEWWAIGPRKKIDLQPCGYNPPTWQTDRRTDTGRQQRPRLYALRRAVKIKSEVALLWPGHTLDCSARCLHDSRTSAAETSGAWCNLATVSWLMWSDSSAYTHAGINCPP